MAKSTVFQARGVSLQLMKRCLFLSAFVVFFMLFPFIVLDIKQSSSHVEFKTNIATKYVTKPIKSVTEYIKKTITAPKYVFDYTDIEMKSVEEFDDPNQIDVSDHKNCENFTRSLKIDVPAILIDDLVLKSVLGNNCGDLTAKYKVKVAIDINQSWSKVDRQRFEIFFYNTSIGTDFIELFTTPKRLLLKNVKYRSVGNLRIPVNMIQFLEFWKRSKYIKCLNIDMKRVNIKPAFDSSTALKNLAMIRNELINANLFPFLAAGTMLGWYRECSVIPHTTDMDIAVLEKEITQNYIDYLLNGSSKLTVMRTLGMLERSFEMTVKIRESSSPWTDVFVIYKEKMENGTIKSYMSGFDSQGWEYRYYSPEYRNFCSAILGNHLFWVTCEPEEKLKVEYGPNWRKDHPSSKYYFSKSPPNVQKFKKHSAKEFRSYFRYFNFKKPSTIKPV